LHVHQFQNVMKRIFFHRDAERGIEGTFNWLVEEVEELREALNEGDKKALENEFANVLAWLASLANVANVDLEKAAISKYDNKCPKCRLTPCDCPP
jgi:NTP pyrophosphatase (non-canonical NTP hydrolase)